MEKDKPDERNLAALKARMGSLARTVVALKPNDPRRSDLMQELLLTNELAAEIEKAEKNKSALIVSSVLILNSIIAFLSFPFPFDGLWAIGVYSHHAVA
jgi:hypothetical protein